MPRKNSHYPPSREMPARGNGGAQAAWPRPGQLFAPPGADAARALELLPEALEEVWPLGKKHRRSLPSDIASLSALLTGNRSELRHGYWERPAFVSAYLYYFLPWNILRLSRLFGGLELPRLPRGPALLADAGSGPLTLPLALWLNLPPQADIRLLATDRQRRPLELGLRVFEALGRLLRRPVWPSEIQKAPLEQLAGCIGAWLQKHAPGQNSPWLITCANTLNELRPTRRKFAALPGLCNGEEEREDLEKQEAEAHGTESLLASLRGIGGTAPALLFVEPGTRLGGTRLMRLRAQALELGYNAVAPCSSQGECPWLGKNGRSSLADSWCHFVFPAQPVPAWLAELACAAGLGKRTLSLSFLLLASRRGPENSLRVLSAPFPASGSVCRYACSPRGLALLTAARGLPAGSLLPDCGKRHGRDAKSGAEILSPPGGKSDGKPAGKSGGNAGGKR